MNMVAGVWIDHRKALIAMVSEAGEESVEIHSNVEKHLGRVDGVPANTPYEAQLVNADDRHQREYTGHLAPYYNRVVDTVRHAKSLLIFGPGEAKGEFKKQLLHAKFDGVILPLEAADKMTDPQIMAKVREHSQK